MTSTTPFHEPEELPELGFGSHGEDEPISRRASLYDPSHVVLGSHVRVDDFALVPAGSDAGVRIGSRVQIAACVALFGLGGIVLKDFVGLASRVTLYSGLGRPLGRLPDPPPRPRRTQARVHRAHRARGACRCRRHRGHSAGRAHRYGLRSRGHESRQR
jgi:dTDP-4-amino-4,6-dideoxy-D-glucose acyltransferase